MSSDKITVNVTCIDMGLPENPREFEVVIKRAQILTLVTKRKLVHAILVGTIFENEQAKHLTLERKSKKHKGYVPLESDSDFKDFFRSLKVKNMTKLIVRRQASVETLPQYTPEAQPNPVPERANNAGPEAMFAAGAETVEQFRKLVSEIQKSEIYEFMRSFSRLYTQAMAPEGIFGDAEAAEQPPQAPAADEKGPEAHSGTVHLGVMCDNCGPNVYGASDDARFVSGWRYKCVVCDDFDLCEKCYKSDVNVGPHSSQHSMVAIQDSEVFRSFLNSGGFSSGRRCHVMFNQHPKVKRCSGIYNSGTREAPEVRSPQVDSQELQTLKEKARLYDELQALLEGVSDSSFGRMKEIIVASKNVKQDARTSPREVEMVDVENVVIDAKENDVSPEADVHERTEDAVEMDSPLERSAEITQSSADPVSESLYSAEPSSVSVTVVPKGQSLSQVILTNTSDRTINGDKLTLSIKNCFDSVVATVPIERKHGIQANRTVKFNVGVSNTHFKYPFKIVLSTENGVGECQLSLKNMVGQLVFLGKEGAKEDADTQTDSDKPVSNSQDGGIARQGSVSSFMTASVHSILLPSLPKEVSLQSPLAQEADTMSEKDDGDANDDYDLISVTDADVTSDLDSEYEILS